MRPLACTLVLLTSAMAASGVHPFAVQRAPARAPESISLLRATYETPDEAIAHAPSAEARQKLRELIKRKPEPLGRAITHARDRGWKPTSNILFGVNGSRGPHRGVAPEGQLARITPAVFQTDQARIAEGEMLIWEWDDGDHSTWDATIYLESYQTGESVLYDVQFRPTGTNTGTVEYGSLIDYDGGWTYRERFQYDDAAGLEFGSQTDPGVRIHQAQTSTRTASERRKCFQQCLQNKTMRWLSRTADALGSSLFGCAFRIGVPTPPTYAGCVGGASLAVMAYFGIKTWMFETSCSSVC